MNVIGILRHGIGIAGVPPIGLAIARGLVIDGIRHADPASLAIQAAGPEEERAWLRRIARVHRTAPLPPGLVLAIRVGNGERAVGAVLVAERETDLGDRPGSILRIGLETIELDRRDGSPPVAVAPSLVGLAEAQAWARAHVA
ncbi:MAG: hypothetical protein J7480_05630 [Microbacteriaceae bacterium]|nr:hypothetical protein [Microbacteriaceae bacterium]